MEVAGRVLLEKPKTILEQVIESDFAKDPTFVRLDLTGQRLMINNPILGKQLPIATARVVIDPWAIDGTGVIYLRSLLLFRFREWQHICIR